MQTFIFKREFFFDKILKHNEIIIKKEVLDKEKNYYQKKIPKKNGYRDLNCLKNHTKFYAIQQNLRKNFLNTVSIPNYVYGFVSGSSYKDFLEPHRKNDVFLRIDIKDFFSTIDKKMINEVFSYYFKINNSTENSYLLNIFSEIVTLNGILPQGGVTSPVVSNIVFRQLDIRIYKYCEKFNITYTRYADDLLFSSKNNLLLRDFFIKKISWILFSKGFSINNNKTKFSHSEISLNGFVIEKNKNIRLSRKKMKDIVSVLFILESKKNVGDHELLKHLNQLNMRKFNNFENVHQYLNGYRAFFIQMLDNEEKENNKKLLRYIDRIEHILLDIYNEK